MATPLPPECKETLRQRLREANAAYHQLTIGGGIREVRDQNGEMVAYTSANRQALYSYILQLQAALGENECGVPVQPTRPLTFLF